MRRWKIMATAALAVATAAGAVGLTLGPASAHDEGAYSSTFVDGGGDLTNDWGEHYEDIGNSLCNGCGSSWNTDTVVLWQSILVAEHLLNRSSIDGKFGSGTAEATKKWQTRYGLTADGKVGDKTWDKADNRLSWATCGCYVIYDGYGDRGQLSLYRGDDTYSWGDGAYRLGSVRDANGDRVSVDNTDANHHIYHKKRTVTLHFW